MAGQSPINIDRLTEDELRDLHYRIVERLRLLSQLRAHGAMMQFSIGDRVTFVSSNRRHYGIVTRYNKKTVSLLVDGGQPWTVSPTLLTRVDQPQPQAHAEPEIVPLPRLPGSDRQPPR